MVALTQILPTGTELPVRSTRREGNGKSRSANLAIDQFPFLAARVEAKICHANKLFATSDNVMYVRSPIR